MRKAYVLIYSDGTGDRDTIRAWANQEALVLHWRYDIPHSFYLISEGSADDLSKSLRAYTGERGRFLIAETNENRQGWLPSESWYLLRNKRQKPK